MANKELCPRCNRPFTESSDAWMNLAGSNNPEFPQKKDYCGVVGKSCHSNALGSCEKWETVFLRKEVKRLEKELRGCQSELEEYKVAELTALQGF